MVEGRGASPRFVIDSAGTSAYHAGEPADARSIAVARKHGVEVPSISRKVRPSDFADFDWIIAMDRANLRDLERAAPADSTARLVLMRDFDPEGGEDVPDPYYGGPGGFDEVYAMVHRSCAAFLAQLEGALP